MAKGLSTKLCRHTLAITRVNVIYFGAAKLGGG